MKKGVSWQDTPISPTGNNKMGGIPGISAFFSDSEHNGHRFPSSWVRWRGFPLVYINPIFIVGGGEKLYHDR